MHDQGGTPGRAASRSAGPGFHHGVASGDPLPDGVVLWTRLTPPSPGPEPVTWRLAADPALGEVLASGEVKAGAEADYTVKIVVDGLRPATTYWYAFSWEGRSSPTGRTRTAPAGPVHQVRLGVVCCSDWATGYFNAYRGLATKDVDVVVHLGDYLYEEDPRRIPTVRPHDPAGRLVGLAAYRARYAQHKTDPDLQALHAAHPMIAVWDDHELAGNAWRHGSPRHDPRTDGDWESRLGAAVQAYLEWMPTRISGRWPLDIWRTVSLGDLCDLLLLDTRIIGRDRPASDRFPVVGVHRRRRSLLGDPQRAWLTGELTGGGPRRWRIVASQVVVAPVHLVALPRPVRRVAGRWLGAVDGGLVVNPGQWDGYPAERDHLLACLAARPGESVVVSGDLHSAWAHELHPGGDGPAVAVEATAPAVSAPSFARMDAPPIPGGQALLEAVIRRQNRHVTWVDTGAHGYTVVDVRPERIETQWWHVDTLVRPDPGEHLAARYEVRWQDPQWRALPIGERVF